MSYRWLALLLATGGATVVACSGGGGSSPSTRPAPPAPAITATTRSTRFVVREHMLAAVEMQLSGEPFATAMGRTLTSYSRDWLPQNVYFDKSPGSTGPWTDLPGFSSGIESYEFSKQPMNDLAFESGAGLSMAYGPLLNPTQDDAERAARRCGSGCRTSAPRPIPRTAYFSTTATAANPLGWPGIWPTLEPFGLVRPHDRIRPAPSPSSARSPPTTIPAPPRRS